MKGMKLMAGFLSAALLFGSCNMNNTGKGSLIGAGGGAAVGSLIGGLVGKGKGAAIGAAVGVAVGTTAGALIGKKMDKAKAAAAQVKNAQVESVTDANGLAAVKVTFDSGILFATSSSVLSAAAKTSLSKFASDVLAQNPDMDVTIYGYTDNTGWKNSTAEQSAQKNVNLSTQRAQSVSNYLLTAGANAAQIKTVEGLGEANPVADNSTAAGREQNRRVEVYLYASQKMIQEAEAQAK
ncbi:MAG: OmpA family protein [Paraprevotella sp.]|nr:OmpA family protein [Paraprevotella sp.]